MAANAARAANGDPAAGPGEADTTTRAPGPAARPVPPWDQPAYGPGGAVYPPDDPAYAPGSQAAPGAGVPSRPASPVRPPGATYPSPAGAYQSSGTAAPAAGTGRPPPAAPARPPSADAAFQQLADSGYAGPAGPAYPPPAGPACPLPADSAYPPPAGPAYPPPAGPAYPLPASSAYPPPPGSPPPGPALVPPGTDTAQFPSSWLDNVGPNPRWEGQPRLPLDPAGPGRRDGGRRRRLLLAGMVALLALVVIVPALLILHAFHGLSGGAGTAPPAAAKPSSGTARVSVQQAARDLAGLLAQSVTDRRSIELAVSDVNQCGPALAEDPQTFRADASSRHRLLSQLAGLQGRMVLPASMIRELTGAWQASMTVDSDLAQWAQDEASHGCRKNDHRDPSLAAASAPNNEATADKAAFVRMWNPLAQRYGLTPYRTSQL